MKVLTIDPFAELNSKVSRAGHLTIGSIWRNEIEEGWESAFTQDVVPQRRTVTGDIAEGPHCLLTHGRIIGSARGTTKRLF